jgi:hypothetical protein
VSLRRLALLLPVFALACAGAADKSDDDDDDDGGDDGGGGPLSTEPLALLLVVDTSASMTEEAGALARALPMLEATRGERELRIGITTPSVDVADGASEELDPGEAGTLVLPVRTSADAGWVRTLTEDLLCTVTPWTAQEVPSDPSHECEDLGLVPDVISQEYLDCLCGFAAWEGNPFGSGDEQHLEGVLLAGCRIEGDPTEACLADGSAFASSAELVHTGWPGDGVERAHALIVSDEGDDSWRLSQGDEDATPYADALAALPVPLSVSAVLPSVREGALPCNDGGATTWGIERIEGVVNRTDGVRGDLSELGDDGECGPGDLDALLESWLLTR